MLSKPYADHVRFLKNGRLPGKFGSTKSNFLRASRQMSLNKKGVLLRNQKYVVKRSEREAIFRRNYQILLHQQIENFTKGIPGEMQRG